MDATTKAKAMRTHNGLYTEIVSFQNLLLASKLAKLNLQLHENKCRIFRVERGTPFLGLIIFPERRRLKRENITRFKRRLKHFQCLSKAKYLYWRRIIQSIRAWIGHAMHADTVRLRKLVIEEVVF